jgi:DNA-directed RNA polymerase specialized sigma24 family protein
MNSDQFDVYSIEDLARACAKEASRRGTPARDSSPCYELFRRAFALPPDGSALQVILDQYSRLISHWLGQHNGEDAVQEVFLRFWKAQNTADSPFVIRFPNISAVMGYLKQCALTVRLETWRKEERRRRLWHKLHDAARVKSVRERTHPDHSDAPFDYKQLVLSKLTDESERVVFELTYYYDLAPREIQAEMPDLFPDVRVIYRVKENLLKRLKRDRELYTCWAGGDSTSSPVQ